MLNHTCALMNGLRYVQVCVLFERLAAIAVPHGFPTAGDVFRLNTGPHSGKGLAISASFFEIYCSKVYDLLNNKQRLRILEDAQGRVRVSVLGACL